VGFGDAGGFGQRGDGGGDGARRVGGDQLGHLALGRAEPVHDLGDAVPHRFLLFVVTLLRRGVGRKRLVEALHRLGGGQQAARGGPGALRVLGRMRELDLQDAVLSPRPRHGAPSAATSRRKAATACPLLGKRGIELA
jgi:hypothetical protein